MKSNSSPDQHGVETSILRLWFLPPGVDSEVSAEEVPEDFLPSAMALAIGVEGARYRARWMRDPKRQDGSDLGTWPSLKQSGRSYGAFLGLQILRPGSGSSLSMEEGVYLEVPGEEVWSKMHRSDRPDQQFNFRSGKPWLGLDPLILEGGSGTAMDFWIRIPNFFLPLHLSAAGAPDPRDGDYAWLTVSLRFGVRDGPLFSLGLAAGADTESFLWVKQARWWPGDLVFGENPQHALAGTKARFEATARHLSLNVPGLPTPSPRSFLRSACERIMGLRADQQPKNAENPNSPLNVLWSLEKGKLESDAKKANEYLQLVFQRTFGCTNSSIDPFLRQVGTALFSTEDLAKPWVESTESLRAKLHSPPWHGQPNLTFGDVDYRTPVSQYVWDQFTEANKKALAKDTEASHCDRLAALIDGLNSVLLGPSIFDAQRFAGVKLRNATLALNASNPRGAELIRLNRLLLEDAYPAELAKKYEDFQGVLLEQRPRSLLEIINHPELRARKWYIQVMEDPREPHLFSGLFHSGWEALMRTWSPNMEESSTALFNLEPAEFRAGLLPCYDLAVVLEPRDNGLPTDPFQELRNLLFRVEPRRPVALVDEEGSHGAWFKMSFPALQNYSGEPLTLMAMIKLGNSPNRTQFVESRRPFPNQQDLALHLEVTLDKGPGREKASVQGFRLGALDFYQADITQRMAKAYCAFQFRRSPAHANQWNCVAPLQVASYWIGSRPDSRQTMGIDTAPLQIPVNIVVPGGTDVSAIETQLLSNGDRTALAKERPLLIFNLSPPKGEWLLLLTVSDSAGLHSAQDLDLHFKLAPNATQASDAESGGILYLDRTPFLVCLLELPALESFDRSHGDELAYWSTRGPVRGWQLQVSGYQFTMRLPPQGLGEAMEKGKADEGYEDVEPGDPVAFRFAAPTTLQLGGSDLERNYGTTPWNLRLVLNSLRDTQLVGLPLRSADLEMLYGLRMKIANTPGLRLAEMFARAGMPRPEMSSQPASGDYVGENKEGVRIYKEFFQSWAKLLAAINSRLAIYEVFENQQQEFGRKGEAIGFEMHGGRGSRQLTAELRKSADVRTSLPAETNSVSAPAGVNTTPFALINRTNYLNELEKRDVGWWAGAIPNYEHGLAGSFSWAFESRLLYEALWTDPLTSNPAVVEAVEATIARLYFSALGGSSTQQASFSGGKIIIAVSVELGLVSELRVEVIGRIAKCWNRCKLVTVFRRTVLPTLQFADQQDWHLGRPMLRKTDEYIDFVEKYRLMVDSQTNSVDPALPGCVKACACDERILVDSRWGVDVYGADGTGIGWKVPLRKPGASKVIYPPANVCLCFHADPSAPSDEVRGRIENLHAVWFWCDLQKDTNADTDSWPVIQGLDTLDELQAPGDMAVDSLDDGDLSQDMVFGSAPVLPHAANATFRIGGLTQEVNLTHHIPPGNQASGGGKPVGSLLQTVTFARADGSALDAKAPPPRPAAHPANAILAHAEHAFSFLSQIAKPAAEGVELVTGWEDAAKKILDQAQIKDAEADEALDLLKAPMAALDRLRKNCEEFERRLHRQLGLFWDFRADATPLTTLIPGILSGSTPESLIKLSTDLKDLSNKVDLTFSTELIQFAQTAQGEFKKLATARDIWVGIIDSTLVKFGDESIAIASALKDDVSRLVDHYAQSPMTSATFEQRLEITIKNYLQEFVGACVTRANWEQALQTLGDHWYDDKTIQHIKNAVVTSLAMADDVPTDRQDATFNQNTRLLVRCWLNSTGTLKTTVANPGPLKDLSDQVKNCVEAVKKVNDQALLVQRDFATAIHRLVTNPTLTVPNLQAQTKKALQDYIKVQTDGLVAYLAQIRQFVTEAKSNLDRFKSLYTAKPDEVLKELGLQPIGSFSGHSLFKAMKTSRDDASQAIQEELIDNKGPLGKMATSLKSLETSLDPATHGWSDKVHSAINAAIDSSYERISGNVLSLATEINSQCGGLLKTLPSGGNISADAKDAILHALNVLAADKGNPGSIKTLVEQRLKGSVGTLQNSIDVLTQAKSRANSLKTHCANLLTDVLDKIVTLPPDWIRCEARRRVQDLEMQLQHFGENIQLPWLRGLPAKFDVTTPIATANEIVWQLDSVAVGECVGSTFNDAISAAKNSIANLQTQLDGWDRLCDDALSSLNQILVSSAITVKIDEVAARLKELSRQINQDFTKLEGLPKKASATLQQLEFDLSDAMKQEAQALKTAMKAQWSTFVIADPRLLIDKFKKTIGFDHLDHFLQPRFSNLEALEFGMADINQWADAQRERLALGLNSLGAALPGSVASIVNTGKGAFRAFRAFGQVPAVPGLDFRGMSTLGNIKRQFPPYLKNLESRIRNVGFGIEKAALDNLTVDYRIRMTPVSALVDRVLDASGQALQSARLQAASVELQVRDIRHKIEADVDALKKSAIDLKKELFDLKKLFPDFGGLKFDQLLGTVGVDLKQLEQKCHIQHGFDAKTLSAYVDSQVDNLLIDGALVIFSLGPVSLQLQKVSLHSHIRVETDRGGAVRRQALGRLVADWQFVFAGQSLITYEQAELKCDNGEIKMELDPKKVRMSSVLKMVSDLVNTYSTGGESGLQAGIRQNLPTEIVGYTKLNLALPTLGGGTSSIQNLRLGLSFELGLLFPNFPSMRGANLRISAGLNLADQQAPFIITCFILGGCGWFTMRVDYVVPFEGRSHPYLQVYCNVAIGASASLALDVGFARGSVFISLAIAVECMVGGGASNTRFSFILTLGGSLNILGIIDISVVITLGIRYSTGHPLEGFGRLKARIRICRFFSIGIDRSFTCHIGGGSNSNMGQNRLNTQSRRLTMRQTQKTRKAHFMRHRQAALMMV